MTVLGRKMHQRSILHSERARMDRLIRSSTAQRPPDRHITGSLRLWTPQRLRLILFEAQRDLMRRAV